jgi:uncharacterized membrane protein YgcG
MRKTFSAVALLLISTLICSSAIVPGKPSGKVWDPDDILTSAQEHMLSEMANIKNLDIKIVAVKDLAPYETASKYAEDLFHTWELGSRDNHNGLLLVVGKTAPHSKDQRDLCRIMTGWDVMKILPDSIVINQIKHKNMMIYLPDKPYEALNGALSGVIENIPNTKKDIPDTGNSVNGEIIITVILSIMFGIIGIFALIFIISWIKDKRDTARYKKNKSLESFSPFVGTYSPNQSYLNTNTKKYGKESSSYYSSGYSSDSKKKSSSSSSSSSNNSSSSSSSCGASTSSCGSSGCGSSGCGGGGCGGGGCGS